MTVPVIEEIECAESCGHHVEVLHLWPIMLHIRAEVGCLLLLPIRFSSQVEATRQHGYSPSPSFFNKMQLQKWDPFGCANRARQVMPWLSCCQASYSIFSSYGCHIQLRDQRLAHFLWVWMGTEFQTGVCWVYIYYNICIPPDCQFLNRENDGF